MKIAVTGASGFIGTEVLKKLAAVPNAEIIALTRHSKKCSSDSYATDRLKWIQTDYSVQSLKEVFCDVDSVIHLAAVRGTEGCIADYHTNEILTENILIAMGDAHVRHIVFASSIAVYSDTTQLPWKEDMPVHPKTLYGITKAACEYLCSYYSKKYGFTYSIVRIAQLLGLGERKKGMMNVFIEMAHNHKQLRVIGKSIAKRQFIYVQDLASILAKLASTPERSSLTINVGMVSAHSNLEIADLINNVFSNETPIDYDDSLPEVIESSIMDISILKNELGFIPLTMEQALVLIRKEIAATSK